jgi:DNA (cytosine-5)-methyltransferase 1
MIKVGTDFSGIGSPEAALRRLNLPHKNVFACEIDKFAKESYLELNNPDTFYEDITTRNHSEVEQLDLYVAGFPCQAFSYAGKRKGFADETRGTLFFDVAEFIRVNQPNCFILENVRGLVSHDKGRTFQTITDILSNGGGSLNGQVGLDTIDNGLGYHVYYKILNTKNFGIPQNRERIFIVGFKNWREFRFPKEFPLDITLKDLLEDDVNEKYYLSQKMIDGFNRHETNNKRLNQNYEKHKDELEKGDFIEKYIIE